MQLKKISCILAALTLSVCLQTAANAEETCATVTANGTQTAYTSFSDAWNSAVEIGKSSEVTVTLNKDWTADGSGSLGSGAGFKNGGLSYSSSKNLTLDLNGFAIDRNLLKPVSNGAVIYVNSVMTISDSRSGEYTVSELFKGGAICNGSSTSRGGGIVIADGAELRFNGGTLLNCVSTDDGGGISITGANAKLTVDGGSFYGNRTYDSSGECCGGAIYSSKASVNIKNSTFECNYAEDNGGAIYADDGTLTVADSAFYSNSSIEEGGAIFADGSVTTEVRDTLFYGNSSTDDDGGAVYCDSNSGARFFDCKMYFNSADDDGGALYVNSEKVFVIGGDFRSNSAGGSGGGIYVDSLYDINASGKLTVSDNTANGKANNLCLQDGKASTAYLYCGGFYEGSSVWLCSTDSDTRLAVRGISKYQYDSYIHFDEGFSSAKINSSTRSDDNIRAAASAVGGGNIPSICIGIAAAAVLTLCTAVIYKKKEKQGGENR